MTFASLLNKTDYLSIMTFSFELQIRNGCLILRSFVLDVNITFFIHSLAQRTNQETSTPSKSPPILGDLTEKLQKPPAFRGFWYRGTRDGFLMLPPSCIVKLYLLTFWFASKYFLYHILFLTSCSISFLEKKEDQVPDI